MDYTVNYDIGPLRANTKEDALIALAKVFDTSVEASQPLLGHVRSAHLDDMERQIALLPQPAKDEATDSYTEQVEVSMRGDLTWALDQDGQPNHIVGGTFGGSARIVPAN